MSDRYSIWEFFNTLRKDSLSIIYLGNFNDTDTDTIISLSEYNISTKEELRKLRKKISFLIAESFQNIVRHNDFSKILPEKEKSPVFYTRNNGDAVYIISANSIEKSKVDSLKAMLDKVNSYDGDQLKQLYLDILNNSGFSEKGGAGLGLIEMARKSGQKLDYTFEEIDEKHVMFYLQIHMNKPSENEVSSYLPIDSSVAFRQLLVENNVVLVYKGDFSRESILPILSVMENNVNTLSQKQKGKVFMVLVELLQNISKHGYTKDEVTEGIMVVKIEGENIIMSAGNWIENKNIIALHKTKDSQDSSSIKSMYKTKLSVEETDVNESIGIGLINISRYSGQNIRYHLKKYNDTISFITISSIL